MPLTGPTPGHRPFDPLWIEGAHRVHALWLSLVARYRLLPIEFRGNCNCFLGEPGDMATLKSLQTWFRLLGPSMGGRLRGFGRESKPYR